MGWACNIPTQVAVAWHEKLGSWPAVSPSTKYHSVSKHPGAHIQQRRQQIHSQKKHMWYILEQQQYGADIINQILHPKHLIWFTPTVRTVCKSGLTGSACPSMAVLGAHHAPSSLRCCLDPPTHGCESAASKVYKKHLIVTALIETSDGNTGRADDSMPRSKPPMPVNRLMVFSLGFTLASACGQDNFILANYLTKVWQKHPLLDITQSACAILSSMHILHRGLALPAPWLHSTSMWACPARRKAT